MDIAQLPIVAQAAQTQSTYPAVHVVAALSNHTCTVILLHGRGSNGPEFAHELFEGRSSANTRLLEQYSTCRWVFPTAQKRCSTVFQEALDEWFDIYSLTEPATREDLQVDGLNQSVTHVKEIIDVEVQLVPASRIVLGGISQGCATAIHALLSGQQRLGAFVGFCSWLPFSSQLDSVAQTVRSCQQSGGVKETFASFYKATLGLEGLEEGPGLEPDAAILTPVFLSHCADDGTVDLSLGQNLRDVLQNLGMDVEWHEYREGGHWITEPEGFDAMVDFISKQMS